MNTLLNSLGSQLFVVPDSVQATPIVQLQQRLVPETGVVLCHGKAGARAGDVRSLSLDELEIVHALCDAINSERRYRIERVIDRYNLSLSDVEPLLSALNLELAVTGRRKKFTVIENGLFKARTFSGGVVFQLTLAT